MLVGFFFFFRRFPARHDAAASHRDRELSAEDFLFFVLQNRDAESKHVTSGPFLRKGLREAVGIGPKYCVIPI